VRLQAASMGLMQHVRAPPAQQMASLLVALDAAQDPVALISVLLQVQQRMHARCMSALLACVHSCAGRQPGRPQRMGLRMRTVLLTHRPLQNAAVRPALHAARHQPAHAHAPRAHALARVGAALRAAV
jgi:hypothetical protein